MSTFTRGRPAGVVPTIVLVAAALLTAAPTAGAVDCGANLAGWTGPKSSTKYEGTIGQVTVTVAFRAGRVTGKQQSAGVERTYRGRYDESNVVHGPNKLAVDVTDAEHDVRDRIDLHKPRCDSAGRVTRAEIKFGGGDIVGPVNRTS